MKATINNSITKKEELDRELEQEIIIILSDMVMNLRVELIINTQFSKILDLQHIQGGH